MTSIMLRIVKQILHDKRSLAMIIAVPLFLLTLLYLLLGKSTYIPVVAANNLPEQISEALKEQSAIEVIAKDSADSDEDYIKSGRADAVISQAADGMHIAMLEPDSVKTAAVTSALKDAVSSLNPQSSINMDFIYGDTDESTFNSIGYLLVGIVSFFIVFIFSGISFVRERTQGTVERLMLTPVRTASVVLGYMAGFSVFALIQSALLIVFSKLVFKMPFAGEWWLAALIMLLIALTAVMFGLLVSAVSKNEFQVMQFIPIVIVPQFFFAGLIPVDTLPYHLSYLSRIMPLYYGSMGLRGVLVYGDDFGEVFPCILALCVYIVVLFAANILAVKKYRAV
ncbi:MAG: ABC transporter permease [Clostridia bacterium]|nr:ABC transporter permease [Clostridia bacterium]